MISENKLKTTQINSYNRPVGHWTYFNQANLKIIIKPTYKLLGIAKHTK